MKILLAEDDAFISELLTELLGMNGYEVQAAYSGTEALLYFKNSVYDLVILDLMLPGKTGMEVLLEIRETSLVPVIMLTAVDNQVVSLLRAGANDYIAKPFDNQELLARIEVQLRAVQIRSSKLLIFKDLELDLERFTATVGGRELSLSKREFAILQVLMENPTKVFTKNNLYQSVWGDEFYGDENTVNVHISKIRAKLGKGDYVQTVWGIGFKMAE